MIKISIILVSLFIALASASTTLPIKWVNCQEKAQWVTHNVSVTYDSKINKATFSLCGRQGKDYTVYGTMFKEYRVMARDFLSVTIPSNVMVLRNVDHCFNFSTDLPMKYDSMLFNFKFRAQFLGFIGCVSVTLLPEALVN